MPQFEALTSRMQQTGIGYAGVPNIWWRPATDPFRLPASVKERLQQIACAVFDFLDLSRELYENDASARDLLEANVPATARLWRSQQPVTCLRPDFQLVRQADGTLDLAITELEIAPSAQGFAHAMQVGYGQPTDLIEALVELLNGRSLLIYGTAAWSEFIPEQLALCRALQAAGVEAQVAYDLPFRQLWAEIKAGSRWRFPLFGLDTRPANWVTDVEASLRQRGLLDFTLDDLNACRADAIFRFGYCNHFANKLFTGWESAGKHFLNPPHFIFDSKVLLSLLSEPALSHQIPTGLQQRLRAVIPTTRLLTRQLLPQLLAEQQAWILKFAGFDAEDAAWGGRSLVVGLAVSPDVWRNALETNLHHPFPVVAQAFSRSACFDVPYWDAQGNEQVLSNGRSRLRSFFMRTPAGTARVAGTHVTFSGHTHQVSENSQAVQAPVDFTPKM